MKILFIGFGETYGGLEQVAFSLCDSLQNNKHEFEFLSYYNIPEETRERISKLNSNRYYVTRYSKNFFRFIKEIISFYFWHPEYDIVYCHANHASMVMYTIPLWFSKKTKIVFHSHASDGNCKYLHKLFRIMVNWRCDLKIACSEQAAEWMYGKNKDIRIVYNGIDVERFKYNSDMRDKIREQYKIKDAYVIGYFSRFAEGKNHLFLIDIFKEVVKIKHNAILLLIGNGKYKNIVLEKLAEYCLSDKAIVLPHQEQIQSFYNASDIFIFPSERESFGLIGIEAQANGLPTLMSDIIPQPVACTPLAVYKSLEETAESWAECACNIGYNGDRERAWQLVKQAGFDKKEMVEKIISLLETIGG